MGVIVIWSKQDWSKMGKTPRGRRLRPVTLLLGTVSCPTQCCGTGVLCGLILWWFFHFEQKKNQHCQKNPTSCILFSLYIFWDWDWEKLRNLTEITEPAMERTKISPEICLIPKYIFFRLKRITPCSHLDIWNRHMTSDARMWIVGLLLGHLVGFHNGISPLKPVLSTY